MKETLHKLIDRVFFVARVPRPLRPRAVLGRRDRTSLLVEVFRSINRPTVLLPWLVLVGIIAVGVIVVAVIRSISVPIGALRDRLRDIAEGEGDLTARVAEDGADEVTEVSSLFNTFVASIASDAPRGLK